MPGRKARPFKAKRVSSPAAAAYLLEGDPIKDGKPSRQRAYQIRHRAEGLCVYCAHKAALGTYVCAMHLLKRREWDRKRRGLKPWHPGGPGRRPKEWEDEVS